MAIHVNGKQIAARGDWFVTCPTLSSYGSGGSFTLTGEISPDNSFTLRRNLTGVGKHAELVTLPGPQLTIAGKVPPLGSTSWGGTYTITGKMPPTNPKCSLDQGDAFTASRLAPLAGTFSGPMILNDTGDTLKFSITAKQGEFVSNEKFRPVYTYLPLTGTITVEGSRCFGHGTADASTHNVVEGDLARVRFKMEDESELWVRVFYTNPEETGLKVSAEVMGGRCDKQGFSGTLSRQ
jgi:hypothetical protein